MTPDDIAWETASIRRARLEGMIAAGLCFAVNIGWFFFDGTLDPGQRAEIMPWRGAGCLFAALWGLGTWRARTTPTAHAVTLLGTISFASCISAIIVLFGAKTYLMAMFSYSPLILGSGLLMSLRLAPSITLQAGLLGAILIAHVLHPVPVPIMETQGAMFSLASFCAIAATVSTGKYRLLHTSFLASHQLEHQNQQLSKTLAQLTKAQARLIESEKLSALGRLLSGLSHEINNPINVIVNSVPPMREYIESYETVLSAHLHHCDHLDMAHIAERAELDFARQDAPEALEAIEEAADRIRAIHANLSNFIRGKGPSCQTGDLNHGLRSTMGMFGRGLPPDVELTADLNPLPPVSAHFDQLNQVHLNLLQNAADAVQDTGSIHVHSFVDPHKHQAVIQISDSGPGIPQPLRAQLFEPFFTTKDPGKGTGLGLSICHEVLENHGGSLALLDTHNPTCFEIRLPLSAHTQPPPTSS